MELNFLINSDKTRSESFLMQAKEIFQIVLRVLFVLFCHAPLAIALYNWKNLDEEPEQNLKIWTAISTGIIDFLFIQWYFVFSSWPLGSTYFLTPFWRIVFLFATIPTFGGLAYCSGVLSDTDYAMTSPSEETIVYLFKQELAIVNFLLLFYGLYILIAISVIINGPLSSYNQKKWVCALYFLLFTGMVIFCAVKAADSEAQEHTEVFIWCVLAGLFISFFILGVTMSTLHPYCLIFLIVLVSIPCIGWTIRGWIVVDRWLNNTGGLFQGRYWLIALSKLMSWTFYPFAFLIVFLLIGLICYKLGLIKKAPEIPVFKQKLRELIVDENNQEASYVDAEDSAAAASPSTPQNQATQNLLARSAKEKLNAEECAICWENFISGQRLLLVEGCKHIFHKDCLRQWVDKDPRCPLCRTYLEKNWETADVENPPAS